MKPNKKFSLAAAGLMLLAASGCSIFHVDSQDVSSGFHPPKPTAESVVLLDTVDRPHEIIGYITVNSERRQTLDHVFDKMKREAAILGADAIIDVKTDANGVWKKLPAQKFIGNGYVRANFTATAIVFK